MSSRSRWSPTGSATICGSNTRSDRARAPESRHSPAPGAAAAARPPPHRAAELAAAVDAGRPGDLLRRRDRHGRQHPSGRSRRRAHADAMVARSQRRLLARRSRQPGAAADHGPALRLSRRSTSRRRRAIRIRCSTGCGACSAIRKQQKAFGRGALRLLYPTNRRVLAYLREYGERGRAPRPSCASPMSSRSAQAVELDLSAVRRARAGGDARRRGVSADRPAAVSADAAAVRLLLVPAGRRGADARLAHAGARAAARIQYLRHSQLARGAAGRAGARACSSARCCRPICPSGAGSAPRTSALEQVQHRRGRRRCRAAPPVLLARDRGADRAAVASAICCRSASSPRTS